MTMEKTQDTKTSQRFSMMLRMFFGTLRILLANISTKNKMIAELQRTQRILFRALDAAHQVQKLTEDELQETRSRRGGGPGSSPGESLDSLRDPGRPDDGNSTSRNHGLAKELKKLEHHRAKVDELTKKDREETGAIIQNVTAMLNAPGRAR